MSHTLKLDPDKSKQAHYIGAEWISGDGEGFESENPASGEILWQGKAASTEQIELAIAAARLALPDWASLGVAARNCVVEKYVEQLGKRQEELGLAIHLETGKPHWESKTEVRSMMAKAGVSLQAYQQRSGSSEATNNGIQVSLQHRAIGVFAVLGPYNFPGHLPNGHLIPALLAGNTAVFKPSELTPRVAELMMQCWIDAGLPAGVINLVQGGAQAGKLLSESDHIDGLLFTGSSKTGQAIHKAFGGKTEKMLALEMGGNNPLLVESVADHAAAVYSIIQSAFISAGQRCTCARRLIMLKTPKNAALLRNLLKTTAAIKVGSGDENFIGPVISNRSADLAESFQDELLDKGGSALLPLRRLENGKPFLQPGIIDVTQAVDIPDEECFGPLLQLKWVATLEEAIKEANNTRYGLAAGLLSDKAESWDSFRLAIRAGIVNWNRPITGASGAAPFGGVGASGNFRPGALYAADYSAFPMASMASAQLELPDTLAPGIQLQEVSFL